MKYFPASPRPTLNARWRDVQDALVVLATVAAEDPDYARKVNGVGFSRSDSAKGHTLAHLSVQSVLQDEATISEVVKMAARYRRQASRLL